MSLGRGDLCRCRSAQAQRAVLFVTSLVLQLWGVTEAADFGVPANLTIRDSTPYAVCLTWTLAGAGGEKATPVPVHLQLIYRPVNASYRVVADLLGHRRSATLDNLRPETQYRLVMTSSANGSLLGTSPVIFFHTPPTVPLGFVPSSYSDRTEVLSAEEIGIIVIVLGVWMMAIMLFFNRWGKIRMLEPYEYNFKYHHPIPEVATHRPSCPLADGAPLLQTSFDRHCSLDRRLAPYGRRCSSLSAYLSTEPRMIRNNSDPAPPAGQPRAAGYRSSMQELRRELGPPETPAARQGQDSPALGVAQAANGAQAGCLGDLAVAPRTGSAVQSAPAGRASPTTSSRRESSREVELSRAWSVTGEDGSRRAEAIRSLERTRELADGRYRATGETSTAPVKPPELDRRLKLSKPVRLICHEPQADSVRDSEV